MKQTTQIKLTPKETEILTLLYRLRFLNRLQIQTMLDHKHHSRIIEWLNNLSENKYIAKFYDKSFTTDPAIYCLDKQGRKYLKSKKEIKLEPLSRVWREAKYSDQFRKHCLFLADIYFSLTAFAKKAGLTLHFYTKTDLYGMEHLIEPKPDAYFALKGKGTKRYFLDVFDDIAPLALRKRVKQYLEYYNSDEWQDHTDKPFPEIILICPNNRLKNHLYYFIQSKISDDSEPFFYLTTREAIVTKGLNRDTLEKVKIKE
jgi:hypothetical protein